MHIASIGGTFRAWVDGAETTLPASLYPWFVTFPRGELLTATKRRPHDPIRQDHEEPPEQDDA